MDEDLTPDELKYLCGLYEYCGVIPAIFNCRDLHEKYCIPLHKKGYVISDWVTKKDSIAVQLTDKGIKTAQLYKSFKEL